MVSPITKAEYYSAEPRSLAEAWAAGDMAVYPYAKSLATKTSISGLVIQKEWVHSLMEPNGECLLLPATVSCIGSRGGSADTSQLLTLEVIHVCTCWTCRIVPQVTFKVTSAQSLTLCFLKDFSDGLGLV